MVLGKEDHDPYLSILSVDVFEQINMDECVDLYVVCFVLFYVCVSVCRGCVAKSDKYGGRESSMRCNFRKHVQIEKAPANQENIFISLTAGAANAHNQIKNFICSVFLFLVVL